MSTYNKMKKRRDHWKKKTVATGADLRYHKKENKRIKKGARCVSAGMARYEKRSWTN
jgi:hypothetical protein